MTQQAAQTLDTYASDFQAVEDELPGHGTKWVRALRNEAIEAYKELGWPTTKLEAWKYTSLEQIQRDHATAARLEPGTLTEDDLSEAWIDGFDPATIVVVNGHVDPKLSDLDGLPEGVTVASLAEILEEEPERLEDELGQHADVREHPFCALNTASFRDGVLVDVAPDTQAGTPIHIVYATQTGSEATITFPRTLIRAGRSSEVDVVETFIGLGEGQMLTDGVTEIVADDNAHVRHVKLQREPRHANHIWTFQATQGRDSTVRSHNLSFGARLTRNNVYDHLAGEGCDTVLNGLYIGEDEQHVDNYTKIRHAEPHGTSHQLYKGVLDDASRGVFRGTIYVAPDAQKTDGYQHNPNLLLSDGAIANSVPQLEIFADDVKCSHGSTTGEMDDEWLFYLQTRGLSEDAARDLMVYAFAGEVIEMIELEPVRDLVAELVLDRLTQGDTVRDAI